VAGRRPSLTPAHSYSTSDLDEALLIRFDKSELVGTGEFSQVFRVIKYPRSASFATSLSTSSRLSAQTSNVEQVFAVKKSKNPFHGRKDREAKLREVAVLKALKHSEHVVQYVDSWEHSFHLYIQTEFCEEGSLDKFLRSVGTGGRLDDFRIWKILGEMTSVGLPAKCLEPQRADHRPQGLNAIHGAGYMHLDLKPANVFITYEGSIKIGDFGIATRWPAKHGIEGEGDREYMAPEILKGQYDRPADVFSLGLILLEMACNVFLPDNGPTWQALREGDLSAVPSLTWDDAASIARDATGTPITYDTGVSPLNELEELEASNSLRSSTASVQAGFPFELASANPSCAADVNSGNKRAQLQKAPAFMADAANPGSLDNVARWMLTPDPDQRPTAGRLLCLDSIKWVSMRRRAGATVFEGNWGPAEVDATDIEMTGV
jgi:mitosis inhibitor protein kinase SWE1